MKVSEVNRELSKILRKMRLYKKPVKEIRRLFNVEVSDKRSLSLYVGPKGFFLYTEKADCIDVPTDFKYLELKYEKEIENHDLVIRKFMFKYLYCVISDDYTVYGNPNIIDTIIKDEKAGLMSKPFGLTSPFTGRFIYTHFDYEKQIMRVFDHKGKFLTRIGITSRSPGHVLNRLTKALVYFDSSKYIKENCEKENILSDDSDYNLTFGMLTEDYISFRDYASKKVN